MRCLTLCALDIAGYIQDLLWDYECVIIPGFGGIMATYRPAEMVLAEHTIYPPSRSLAFNELLTVNDGLLITHMCRKGQLSYSEASGELETWVKKTQNLLYNNEEIYLPRIGRFYKDLEKNLRFEPDTAVNYLPSAYGLPKVIAEPMLRSKSVADIEVMEPHRASYALPKANKKWAMAAVIILFLALGSVADLMYRGVEVRPLDLNAAGVLSFLENFKKPAEASLEMKASLNKSIPDFSATPKGSMPAPVPHAENPAENATVNNNSVSTPPTVIEEPSATAGSSTGKKYYVIIGAFRRRANFLHAEANLRDKHPGENIYEDTSLEKKRIGFYAGDNYSAALEKLNEARKDQPDYWLLVKR